jgi:primosomal protein N' (replication factor Y)
VTTARPLRLKRQEAARLDTQSAVANPYVKVWVDTGVSHLDGTYDYLVPERLSSQVIPGIRIGVPFAGRDVEALVLQRTDITDVTNLKYISSVISEQKVASPVLIDLISSVSKRWICHPYDLVKAAIPTRIASVDKALTIHLDSNGAKSNRARATASAAYLHLQPSEDSLAKLAEFAIKKSAKGSVLILLPEEREVIEVQSKLGDQAIVLSSSLSRTERYQNYLRAINSTRSIVIGTRSAIFATPNDLETLIIYRENSQSHYEPRHPGWNVRDIALMRGAKEKLNLFFVGFSPSLEMAQLIDSGKVDLLGKKSRLSVKAFSPQGSELLPERIFSPIRGALKDGPVLFLVPKKGYASALMCKKCKNIATCDCGGKLSRRSQSSPPECVHCSKLFGDWVCRWCNEDKLILLGRGAIRHGEEIGRAFPGYAVVNSDADAVVKEITDRKSLVIATPGMAPYFPDGYSAVVLLEGAAFFSYSDLRGQERSREAFFEASSHIKAGREILISIDSSHPIIAALSTWNPAHMYKRELSELKELHLPPFSRAVTIDVPVKEASSIVEGFKKSLLDQRLPASTRVFGPAIRNVETARILLTASTVDFVQLTEFLGEFIKHRAITKKNSLQLRIDPYSLS